MEDNWKDCELGDVIELKRGYDLPKSKRKDGTVPIISSSGSSGCHNDFKISSPGVVTGRYGTIGEVFYVEENFWPLNTTLYVKDFKGNDPLFIYYLLQTISFQDYTDKGAVPGINRNHVHKAKVRVPESLEIQRDLGKKLYQFEQRMRLNQQTNKTLEQMAQALFKSWFVDFDPVVDNVLAAGNPIPDELGRRVEVRKKAHALPDFQPLPENTRSLFPSEFEQTGEPTVGIDGWVPKGWKVGQLKQHAQIKMGQSPKGDTYNSDGVGMPLVNGPVEFGDYFTKKSKWTSAPTKTSEKGDLIVCVRGSTTGRYVKSNGVYCIGRGVCSVTGKLSQVFTDFIFINSINSLLGLATGSTFPNWSSQILNEFKVILPEKSVIKVFDYFASKNASKIESNVIESESLTKLRDTLLPKLISGEIQLHSTVNNGINNEAELQGV